MGFHELIFERLWGGIFLFFLSTMRGGIRKKFGIE